MAGFADGINAGFGAANMGNTYRRNKSLADKLAAANKVNQPAPNTDGTHDHLGEASDAFPDGYTTQTITPDGE